MKIEGREYTVQDITKSLTVPDCLVMGPNKIGKGNGEAKFYFGSKPALDSFAMGKDVLECFFLKEDLKKYLYAVECEYKNPTQNYAGRNKMPELWAKRLQEISQLPDVIEFTVSVQTQIAGPRGYLNSNDEAYRLLRMLSLPFISFVSIMRLVNPKGGVKYYWRLFADFQAMEARRSEPLVLTYGKGHKAASVSAEEKAKAEKEKKEKRDSAAQRFFRDALFAECPFCPITRISDERLLVASHIKPCAVANMKEIRDPKNGFTLSPLYDRLFDQGYITFDEKKRMNVSHWISPSNQKRCLISEGTYIQQLPLDDEREEYLKYHRQFVFKG
jgi:putative restriction endonuclease